MASKHDQIRIAAEESLEKFIKLIAPHRVLGDCHRELIKWWEREEASSHQLVLMPRDHQKSAMLAYRVAWTITRDPCATFLYISSTTKLAEKQLKFIKDILESKTYQRYWPEMIKKKESERAKWSQSEIEVDHPKRKAEFVRDPTIFCAGLTTSITGLHFSHACLDDVVVQENAYIKEGRDKVKAQYSLLASIETTGAQEWAVGTRYHPDDLYGEMQEMVKEVYDDKGQVIQKTPVYEIFERRVEDAGDGTGDFLWPRQKREDGKWFGFDMNILAQKRAQYLDRAQFRAQYYNNPNDPDSEAISSDYFQRYDRKYLEKYNGTWCFRQTPLKVYAAIDFAFSLNAKADFTALVVIGIDPDGNIYILDIDRFKTNKISEYYERIFKAQIEWGFRKLRAEVTVAQEAIVEDLKDRIRREGLALSIDGYRPLRYEGSKEERIAATLNPRYENRSIWHYNSGIIQELEDELRQARPRHDDIKDALASAVAIAVPPARLRGKKRERKVVTHPRFGGVSY